MLKSSLSDVASLEEVKTYGNFDKLFQSKRFESTSDAVCGRHGRHLQLAGRNPTGRPEIKASDRSGISDSRSQF